VEACVALAAAVGLAEAGVYSDLVLSDTPVGYWRLGEAVGPTANDETTPAYNGTYSGGTTLGQPGALRADPDTAVQFDGSSGKADVAYTAALNPPSFTAEAWAKVEGGSGYRSPVTSRSGTGGESGYIFYASPANTWQFWTGTGSAWHTSFGPAVQNNAWTHLVGSYDGATQQKILYVNGRRVDIDGGVGFQQNSSQDLHIGAGGDTGTQYRFNGDVDEVAVYNQALHHADVAKHYIAAQYGPFWGLLDGADFENPGGAGLGPDASAMSFAGRTGSAPAPTNPDGTLVLGGGGSGGYIVTDDLPTYVADYPALMLETQARYVNGDAPASNSNAYFGLKALHLEGTSDTGADRRGGLFAQFQPLTSGSAHMRLGFQSAETPADGNDVWHDHALSQWVSGFSDANAPFTMQLILLGLADTDPLIFSVSQGSWQAELSTTIGAYRTNLGDIAAAQAAFDLVLSELRAQPWRMDYGFISTGSRDDGYDYLRLYGFTPEPGTLSLLAFGGLALLRRRRKRGDRGHAAALGLVLLLTFGLLAGGGHAAPFSAATYSYSTTPNAHPTVYQDDALNVGSSVADLNDGVLVPVGSSYSIPDASVGWGVNTSVDIDMDLGGLFRVNSISIGHAGIPNYAKWAPDDVVVSFSTDGTTFSKPISSSAFTLFTAPGTTYQRADLGLNQPRVASHVRLSFDGGVTQNTGNFNGYLLDDVSFDGRPMLEQVLPYPNNADPNVAVLYHLNERTGRHSQQPGNNWIGDGSGNGQHLRTNWDTSNPSSMTSNPGLSPFDGVAGPPGLGTAMSQTNIQRAYRNGNANMNLFNTQTFTMEAWIRNPASSNFPGILRVDDNQGALGLIQFGLDGNGDQLRLAGFGADGAFRAYVSTETVAFEPDTWYHVAVAYEGDGTGNDSLVRFFLDSEHDLAEAITRPGTQLGDVLTAVQDFRPFAGVTNGDIWVGELQGANHFFGDLVEVRWTNAALSEFNLAWSPEPTTLLLFGTGGLVLLRRRRKK
jgi:hypothetical protein